MKRAIKPKMIEFLDKKLKGNGLADAAIATKDARTLFRLAAQACVGIREEGGNNRGAMVELLQSTLGGADGEAWCMGAVQTCIAYAEVKTGIKSPIEASEHCLTVWTETPKEQRVKNIPLPGAIAIWQHGNTSNGHTGIVDACDGEIFYAFEGNTSGGVDANGKVERDGGGFYHTKRSMKGDGTMKLKGFLKPFPADAPKTTDLPKADWKNEEWTKILVREIADRGPSLLALNPSMQYWVMLFSALARYESGFDPKCIYTEKFKDNNGKNVVSRGLFQLSQESANGYKGVSIKNAEDLHDPATNIRTAVIIANKLVGDDKVLYGKKDGKWQSLSRYWSPWRDPKRTEGIMAKIRAVV